MKRKTYERPTLVKRSSLPLIVAEGPTLDLDP